MENKEKAIIYLRTSTKDQNPELQRKQCIYFGDVMNLDIVEIVVEQGSAYKLEKIRPKWESVVERAKKEKLHIILWRYDRSFRNRAEFFKFMKVIFEVYGKKVYSVTEPSILSFWNMMSNNHSDNPVYNELLNGIFKALWDFMIQQSGEEAEDESRKKSNRVKLAVVKEKGKSTKSYKGNKWGRPKVHTNKINVILELRNKGLSYRDIKEKSGLSIGKISQILRSKNQNTKLKGEI